MIGTTQRDVRNAVERVSIFRSILEDEAVGLVVQLIEQIEDGLNVDAVYARLFKLLAECTELADQPVVGSAWQNHLLEVMLLDDNVFARKAESAGEAGLGSALKEQVKSELSLLRALYDLPLDEISSSFASLNAFQPIECAYVNQARLEIKKLLNEYRLWEECLPDLVAFYSTHGSGEFGRFRAFRWVRDDGKGRLKGVASPDPIQLSDLVEYEWQRSDVKRNTQKLLMGLPTNNMLLYGDRGTGKSSTVKAMLNEFGDQKLRLVEVAKEDLIDLPEILSTLRKRPEKFILFIDDLSFEENETQYKALKAVLEGGLEARPANVALYATSNRRNLIKERFSDRLKEEDEVHPGDTMQEKLSLSDRFGLKIPFLSPDLEEYLRIVTALADRAGIEMTEDLRKKAAAWQHARSGRSARQFVDYIIGEMAIEKQVG